MAFRVWPDQAATLLQQLQDREKINVEIKVANVHVDGRKTSRRLIGSLLG
jgi:hypothetical protein